MCCLTITNAQTTFTASTLRGDTVKIALTKQLQVNSFYLEILLALLNQILELLIKICKNY